MDSPRPLIAIVDDEESVRKALERLLRSAALDARVFASGEAFLADVAELQPHCVLLDLHMPGMSGFEVLTKLNRRLPVVVLTGHDSQEAETRALAGGALAFLRKPVSDRVLLDAISATIAHGPPAAAAPP